MRGYLLILAPAASSLFCASALAATPAAAGGVSIVPGSSIERPADRGVRAHTNVELFVPNGGLPMTAANTPGGYFETPASLACVYHQVTPQIAGCSPAVATAVSVRGSRAIAVVDAYNDPNITSDLTAFASEFGLPAPTRNNFEIVYATPGGSTATTNPPPVDSTGGWELEEATDVEMAHSMAPRAKVYLVEAASNGFADLLPAVQLASNLVAAAGGGEVTMSWGTGDFDGESNVDTYFQTPGVVYFSSAGDSAGVNWPSASPYVVSAGGTSINRNPANGDYVTQGAWANTGGGVSAYEARPSYQDGIAAIVGSGRGTPDMSFDSDGRTGVWIYDSFPYYDVAGTWWIVNGTSVASAGLAGLVNAAKSFNTSTAAELTEVYSNLGKAGVFFDITNANCGPYGGYLAAKGWDPCTGVGTVDGVIGK